MSHFGRRCIPSGCVAKTRNIQIFLRFRALPVGRLNAQKREFIFSEPIGVDSWGLMIDARVPQETVDEPEIGGRFWPILSSRTA
jgi:hypothetical protein